MTDASYSSLTAVKRQQVIEMEESEITRLGRTAITTASFVAGTVYPELLKTGSESSAEESSGPENSGESSAQEGYKTLQAGDSGDEVKKLQERLAKNMQSPTRRRLKRCCFSKRNLPSAK